MLAKAMPSVIDRALLQGELVADAPASSEKPELVSTPDAATMMGISEATLRNYAWLNSLCTTERASRKLQEPPAGLPIPTRKSGRLLWPLAEVVKFVELKTKHAE